MNKPTKIIIAACSIAAFLLAAMLIAYPLFCRRTATPCLRMGYEGRQLFLTLYSHGVTNECNPFPEPGEFTSSTEYWNRLVTNGVLDQRAVMWVTAGRATSSIVRKNDNAWSIVEGVPSPAGRAHPLLVSGNLKFTCSPDRKPVLTDPMFLDRRCPPLRSGGFVVINSDGKVRIFRKDQLSIFVEEQQTPLALITP
jgi:hypothetical protein